MKHETRHRFEEKLFQAVIAKISEYNTKVNPSHHIHIRTPAELSMFYDLAESECEDTILGRQARVVKTLVDQARKQGAAALRLN